jgi:protocatechuate 3,4-dioxygenase beta subunit
MRGRTPQLAAVLALLGAQFFPSIVPAIVEKPPEEKPPEIAGQVVDETGTPIAAAELVLGCAEGPESKIRPRGRTRTTALGTFRMTGLPSDRVCELTATHPAYARTVVFAQAAPEARPRPVRLVLSPGPSTAGRVIDDQGQPVSEATVDLRQSAESAERQRDVDYRATTGVDGRFTLSHLQTSAADLTVSAKGFRTLSLPALSFPRTGTLNLSTLTLSPGVVVSGKVTDPQGNPVAGAEIHEARLQVAAWEDDGVAPGPGAITGADGRFSWNADPQGGLLLVHRAGYQETRVGWAGLPTAPVTAVLRPLCRISGRVSAPDGSPVPGAKVSLTSPVAPAMLDVAASTDDSGRFELTSESAGSFELSASAHGFLAASFPSRVRVGDGAEVRGIEIRLGEGATIRGRVTTSAGEPVAGATVGTDKDDYTVVTDGDGRYRLTGMKLGPATIEAEEATGEEGSARGALDVQRGENQLDLLLDPAPQHAVHGRVLDETGAPVVGAVIFVGGYSLGVTAEEGLFAFDLAEGKYTLAAETLEAGGRGEAAIEVAGADLSGVEIHLMRPGTLVGRVSGLDAEELRQLRIVASAILADHVQFGTHPDLSGHYRLTGLPPDGYSVVALLGARRIEAAKYPSVEPGAEAVLDLAFPPRLEVRGRVTAGDSGKPLVGAKVILRGVDSPYIEDAALTGVDGTYALAVTVGGYFVTAEAPGFAFSDRREITVDAAGMHGVDFPLQPLPDREAHPTTTGPAPTPPTPP